jgi:hypothetical protein
MDTSSPPSTHDHAFKPVPEFSNSNKLRYCCTVCGAYGYRKITGQFILYLDKGKPVYTPRPSWDTREKMTLKAYAWGGCSWDDDNERYEQKARRPAYQDEKRFRRAIRGR